MNHSFLWRWLSISSTFSLLIILAQCATPGSLTGGAKDETPPRVVTEKSTPNEQTNFRPERIQLTFDEWVKLKDVGTQVLISPPFNGYDVRLKGKSVIFEFGDKDTLRDNVTYVIQFGEAVQDLTESNPAENLRFVFSTGPYIDSLEYQGTVVDAYTSEPVKDITVLLYDNLNDTVFQKDRPLYFGKTNEQGLFAISNLRSGQYLVRALQDADANYRYNQVSEPIAFLSDPITLPVDTAATKPATNLRLFQQARTPQVIGIDSSEAGVLELVFDRELTHKNAIYARINAKDTLFQAVESDTLWFWQRASSKQTVYFAYDTLLYDTLRLSTAPDLSSTEVEGLQVRAIPMDFRQENPLADYRIGFNRPLSDLDTALVQFRYDTLDEQALRWRIDSLDQRQLAIRPIGAWKQSGRYQISLLPNALTDIWGRTNADTIVERWSITPRKNLGNLVLDFSTDEPEQHFLVLVRQKDKPPVAGLRLYGESVYNVQVEAIPPGDYQLEIIWDDNANGRWDSGTYVPRQLPEEVDIKALETLRANWDLVSEVFLSRS